MDAYEAAASLTATDFALTSKINRQTDRWKDRQTEEQTDIGREKDIQAERKMGRKSDKEKDRQTETPSICLWSNTRFSIIHSVYLQELYIYCNEVEETRRKRRRQAGRQRGEKETEEVSIGNHFPTFAHISGNEQLSSLKLSLLADCSSGCGNGPIMPP